MSISRKSNILKLSKNILYKPPSNPQNEKYIKSMKIMKQMKKGIVETKYSRKYGMNMQYNEMELHIFNHKGWICGYFDDDFTSADLIFMRCGQKDPKGILLGNCNISDYRTYSEGYDKYLSPKLEKISGETLLARQLFLEYFRKSFPTDMNYIKMTGDYIIGEANDIYKNYMFDANLSLAYYACFHDKKKVIFSSPQNLVVFEDLVMNMKLEELQYAFYQVIQEIKLKSNKQKKYPPALNPMDFNKYLQRISQEIHADTLYDKKCQYSAAVFRKIHKLYPDNILFMPNNLVTKTYEHITDSFCPEYDEIFRNKEFKQKLRESNNDFKALEEVLEKCCILSKILDQEFSIFINNESNPLKVMFGGKFNHFSDSQVFEIFRKINASYQVELEKIFFDDLKRVDELPTFGRSWTKQYSEEIKKWEKYSEISKSLPENRFVVDKLRKLEEMKYINQLLLIQIGINIKQKEMNGINLYQTKLHLRNYFSGYKTEQNNNIFNELLVEANAQLKLLKLPSSFKKFQYKLSEVLYHQMEELIGEDPFKYYQRAVSKIYNQLRGIDPFIIKDGSEPEMKENMLNRNQIKLLDIPKKFIFNQNENEEKFGPKSLNPNKYNNSLVKRAYKKFEEIKKIPEIIDKLKDSSIDISDIQKTNDDKELKKLELIEELKQAFDEEKLMAPQMFNSKFVDLDIFKNKTIDELKNMNIEEIATLDFEGDQDGFLRSYDFNTKNDESLEELERHMTSGRNNQYTTMDLTKQKPEMNFFANYSKIFDEVSKRDEERSKKIEEALKKGEYFDDPIYVQLLMSENRFVKLREKFLKKYYSGQNDKNDPEVAKIKKLKMPLLDKYAKMPGDIVNNMADDNIFYKYDHEFGKRVSDLYQTFNEEISFDDPISGIEEDPDKLGTTLQHEQEDEEKMIGNMNEFIRDKVFELKLGKNKSIYNKIEKENPVESNQQNSDKFNSYQRDKGRSKKNNKLKLL